MEIVYGVTVFIALAAVLALIGTVLSFPGWVLGWLNAARRRPPTLIPAVLIETRLRRWLLWAISALTAVVGAAIAAQQERYLLGGLIWLVGFAAMQVWAYTIGHMGRDRHLAHREQHLYAPPPAGVPGSTVAPTSDPVAPAQTEEAAQRPAVVDPTNDGATEEYPMATPQQD